MRENLAELTIPPILVVPDWDAVADGSLPFHVYCDACIDICCATFELEKPDGSARPTTYISRTTPDSEKHWISLDLENGNIVWATNRRRGYLSGTKFGIFSDHKGLEIIGIAGDHNARVQRWLEFLTAFDCPLEYCKGMSNINDDFLSVCQSLPRNATAVSLAASPLSLMAASSSCRPAGFAFILHRPPVLA